MKTTDSTVAEAFPGDLLALLIYHERKAEVAEVYGRLHQEEDMRLEWQETRNRHLRFVRALKQANARLDRQGDRG
jgi:hypothetical protein